jgi:hypothetical protein
MKIRTADLDNMTAGTLHAVLMVLNASPETPLDLRQRQHKTLEFTVAAQRRLARKRLKELQTTAHVVKGSWGLVEVRPADLNARAAGSRKRFSDSGRPRTAWVRGSGKGWPIEDAERYAKLFGGTVRRFS